jgi:hypothetical protein
MPVASLLMKCGEPAIQNRTFCVVHGHIIRDMTS